MKRNSMFHTILQCDINHFFSSVSEVFTKMSNRRSLMGSREVEPPQRIRISQEFPPGPGPRAGAGARAGARQSRAGKLGPSGGGAALARGSSAGVTSGKRTSSMSRLPLPKVGRSSSGGGAGVLTERQRSAITPNRSRSSNARDQTSIRKKTDFTTPQRVAPSR